MWRKCAPLTIASIDFIYFFAACNISEQKEMDGALNTGVHDGGSRLPNGKWEASMIGVV